MKSEMIFFFEIKRKKVNFKSKFTQALQTLDYSSAAVFLCVRKVLWMNHLHSFPLRKRKNKVEGQNHKTKLASRQLVRWQISPGFHSQ
jgi:hypothetical protein